MSESTEMAVNQIAALGARQLAGILEGVSGERLQELIALIDGRRTCTAAPREGRGS
ncbi:MAG: hypothetical protein ACLTZW_02475 [Paratractidigestivibacter faecalis]